MSALLAMPAPIMRIIILFGSVSGQYLKMIGML